MQRELWVVHVGGVRLPSEQELHLFSTFCHCYFQTTWFCWHFQAIIIGHYIQGKCGDASINHKELVEVFSLVGKPRGDPEHAGCVL